MARTVAILGVTGSIGTQALDIVTASRGTEHELRLVAVGAGSSWEQTLETAARYGAPEIYLADPRARGQAVDALARDRGAGIRPVHLADSVGELLDRAQPDVLLNSVVGVAGLEATLAALERGIDVALANKESLVAAGELCMRTARSAGAAIIPVDSEHSALQQCLQASQPDEIASLVLTASGGPFYGWSAEQLQRVTVAQALDHPTWNMGGKITIDSATLMNKGLELIEATVLFGVSADDVEVVVHRHSIVHALVRHLDGSLLAHLGWPDMRVPISWALHHPRRPHVDTRKLDLVDMPPLEFHEPDPETFRCLALAREAAAHGGAAPCALNAANEEAVSAFLAERIGFLQIGEVVGRTLDRCSAGLGGAPESIEQVREIDRLAREAARNCLSAVGDRSTFTSTP